MIRAKMKCLSVTKTEHGEVIDLEPVVSGSEENKQWSRWTPSGSLKLTITNPEAQGQHVPGAEYFLDLEPAPPVPRP